MTDHKQLPADEDKSILIMQLLKTLFLSVISLWAVSRPALTVSVSSNLQHVLDDDTTCLSPNIVTGVYDNPPKIVVHNACKGDIWTWTHYDAQRHMYKESDDVFKCLSNGNSATEVKWVAEREWILAIYGNAAIIVNYSDKQLVFAVCLNDNSHSLELVPDDKLALATTSHTLQGSIKIFDCAQNNSLPIQELHLLPACHALVWDEHDQTLWAVGNDKPPSGNYGKSYGILNGYQYDKRKGQFRQAVLDTHRVTEAALLLEEWTDADYAGWWDGPHDVIPIPNERKLLITTDRDIHIFDITNGSFEHGDAVMQKYLPGFQPVDHRTGRNGVLLPRSDLKAVSINANRDVIYVQSDWKSWSSSHVNLLVDGAKKPDINFSGIIYRSRWMDEVSGWPAA